MKDENKIPKGYKSSALGPIPNDWDVMELSKLFEFKNGINAGRESYGSGVKFINVMEVIYNDRVTPDIIPGSVNISVDHKDLYLVKNGDVLFNRTSETTEEIGLTAVYEGTEEVVFGGFVIRARPIDKSLVNIFKRYCFRSKIVRDQIITRGQGAVRSNIGQGDLEKVCIPIPPTKEQTVIANLLNTWDRAINSLSQLIGKKELRKKWLMQQLLTGKKRLKGFKGEYTRIRIRDVAEVFSGGTPSRDNATFFNGHIPWIKSGEINDFEIYDTEEKITEEGLNSSSAKRVKKDTILIALYGATAGVVGISRIEAAINQAVLAVIPDQKKIDKMYFLRCLQLHLPKAVENLVQGGQPNLSGGIILNYQFSIVNSIEQQIAIAYVLQSSDDELNILRQKLDKLKEQKKGLMQILLTGKKRLKVK